jgi:hypothetical protein
MRTDLALWGAAAAIGLSASAIAGAAPAATTFHRPQTPPEISLSAALKRADADDEQLDNLFHRYGPVPRAKRVDYAQYLTARFWDRLRRQEAAMVRKDCGGRYEDGEVCGMESSPITCAQDTLPAPLAYRSEPSADGRVRVWLKDAGGSPATLYVMAHEGGVWKIDDARCQP